MVQQGWGHLRAVYSLTADRHHQRTFFMSTEQPITRGSVSTTVQVSPRRQFADDARVKHRFVLPGKQRWISCTAGGRSGALHWISPLQQEMSRGHCGSKAPGRSASDRTSLRNGHVLLEGVPRAGKDSLAEDLGQLRRPEFKRLQFTPDMLPADIVGTMSTSAER